MANIDFVGTVHTQTTRDYLARVLRHDKAHCAIVAKQFGFDYWDGDRRYGYGGYSYDGRWEPVARRMADHYNLQAGMSVLDIGCGKGFLLHELAHAVPGLRVCGLDISSYALEHAKPEVGRHLAQGSAVALPYEDASFDLVLSLNTLHYLRIFDLSKALREIQRVGRKDGYIVVESYRTEEEKANLLHWQLTCECIYTPAEWEWLFERFGYRGDHSFVFFT